MPALDAPRASCLGQTTKTSPNWLWGGDGRILPCGELSKVSLKHTGLTPQKRDYTWDLSVSLPCFGLPCTFFRRQRERKGHSAAHPAAQLQPASPLPAQELAGQIFGWRKSLLACTGVFASSDAFPQAFLSLLSPFHANCCDGACSTQAAAGAQPQQRGSGTRFPRPRSWKNTAQTGTVLSLCPETHSAPGSLSASANWKINANVAFPMVETRPCGGPDVRTSGGSVPAV